MLDFFQQNWSDIMTIINMIGLLLFGAKRRVGGGND